MEDYRTSCSYREHRRGSTALYRMPQVSGLADEASLVRLPPRCYGQETLFAAYEEERAEAKEATKRTDDWDLRLEVGGREEFVSDLPSLRIFCTKLDFEQHDKTVIDLIFSKL